MLFVLAHCQGLALLRMHTDATVEILNKTTALLGHTLREFKDKVCPKYATRELAREAAARQRRAKPDAVENTRNKSKAGRRRKSFNLNTIKLHSIGDYALNIPLFGTSDSYSTQAVSILSHWKCSAYRLVM